MTSEPSEKVPVARDGSMEGIRAQYRALLAAVDAGVCLVDADGRIVSADDDFVAFVGESEETMGRPLSAFVSAVDGAERLDELVEAVFGSDDPAADGRSIEGTLAADGRRVEIRLQRVESPGSDGGSDAAVAVVRDRSDGSSVTGDAPRDALVNAESQFESLVEAVEEYAIFVLDADGRVATWNEGASRIKGYDREEILGEHYSTFYTESDAEAGAPEANLARAREEGSIEMEGWRIRKDGSQFWANANLTVIRDDDGELVGYTKVTRDMSARRENQEMVREERDLLKQVLETSPVGIVVLSPDGRVIRGDVTGASEVVEVDEEMSVDDFDVYDADGDPVPSEELPFMATFETGEPVSDWVCQLETDDGRTWLSINAAPIHDAGGDVDRVVVAVEDITVYKRQQAEIERQRDELESEITEIFDRVTDGFFGLDEDWRFTYVNEEAERLLGRNADELVGENVWDLFVEESAETFRDHYERAMETQEPVNFEAYYEEPLDKWFHISAYPSETGLSVYFRDVTERKEYESELAESEERYRTLVENLPNAAVTVFDTDLRYTLAGGGAFDDVDFDPDDVIGKTVYEVFEEYSENEAAPHERALEGEHVTREVEFGSRVYENTVRPIHDDDGDVVAVMSVSVDVTERKEYEETLTALTEATRTLPHAQTKVDVAEQLVDVATETLGLPGVTVYLHDPVEDRLYDAAHSDGMEKVYGNLPTMSDDPQSSITANAFHGGETRVYEDIHESDLLANAESPVRRSLFVPLGDHGVLVTGDSETAEFDERTVELAELVGANATSAFGRVEREQALRENERELRRYGQIVDTVWDGVYAVDDEGKFVLINDAFLEMTGYDREELIGESAEMLYDEEIKPEAERLAAEVQRGERDVAVLEFDIVAKDGERIPIESRFGPYQYTEDSYGRTGVVRDVTERKEREEKLREKERRYQAVFNDPNILVGLIGTDGSVIDINEKAMEYIDATLDDVRGKPFWETEWFAHSEEAQAEVRDWVDRAAAGEYVDFDADLVRPDGEPFSIEGVVRPVTDEEGNVVSLLISDRDVTERKAHKRQLQTRIHQQRAVTELGQFALETTDLDGLFRKATEVVSNTLDNDYCKVLDLDDAGNELLLRQGVGWDDGIVGNATVDANKNSQAGYTLISEEPVVVSDLATETRFTGPDLLTDHDVTSGISVVIGTHDDPWGILGTHDRERKEFTEHDVNFVLSVANILTNAISRRKQERQLRTRIQQQQAITELGQYALRNPDFDDLLHEASRVVTDTLDIDFCKALELDADRNALSVRAGAGWDRGSLDDATVSSNTDTQAGYTLLTDKPIVIEDFESERRFRRSDLLADHGVRSGVSAVVGARGDPWGVIGAHDTEPRTFTDNDVAFVQSVANIIANAVTRRGQERVLEHQREQLAALNQLNRVVQGINKALVQQSSREEIEQLVCDRLADTYLFAWVGEVGRGERTIRLRTESGVENYLDNVTIDLDDERTANGPTAKAIRTGEMQVTNDIPDNPDYEPWRENAATYGFESSVAIPITYEGSTYGVLNVYSERPDAFSGQEGAVVGQLGGIIGHAINSVEQKKALMSDEMVELEFHLPDVVGIVGDDRADTGRVEFERIIPTGGDEYLVYGSMDAAGRETMNALIDGLPHFGEVRILSDDGDEAAFELQLHDPPAVSLIASQGGRVANASIRNGNYEMAVHLPQTADVREVVSALREKYPDVELLAQRRTSKPDRGSAGSGAILRADLTDRQRAVLEAAFRSGFFEWPRESTGEDVAESVGITASTLHQHLRAAERKLVDAYLEG